MTQEHKKNQEGQEEQAEGNREAQKVARGSEACKKKYGDIRDSARNKLNYWQKMRYDQHKGAEDMGKGVEKVVTATMTLNPIEAVKRSVSGTLDVFKGSIKSGIAPVTAIH